MPFTEDELIPKRPLEKYQIYEAMLEVMKVEDRLKEHELLVFEDLKSRESVAKIRDSIYLNPL